MHTGIYGPEIFTNHEVGTVQGDILHQSQGNVRSQGQIPSTSSTLGLKVLKGPIGKSIISCPCMSYIGTV